MIVTHDTLIVSDKRNNKIFLFDKNGQFIRSIYRLGRGPGEYGNLGDFTYHNGIFIFDPLTQQVHLYSMQGEWIHSKKYPTYAAGTAFDTNQEAMIFYRNSLDFMTPGKGFNFASFKMDSLSQIIDSASLIAKELINRGLHTGNPFSRYKENIYALPPFENVIYVMNAQGKIDSAYSIEVPAGMRLEEEADWKNLQLVESDFMLAMEKFTSIHFYGSIGVNARSIFFGFRKGKDHHHALYNKQTGQTHLYPSQLLTNDEDIFLSFKYADDQHLYFFVNGNRQKIGEWLNIEMKEEVGQVILPLKIK
jgi:hypothetical protein